MAAVENPDRVFFWAPSTNKLQAGILDRLVRPPATPFNSEEKIYNLQDS